MAQCLGFLMQVLDPLEEGRPHAADSVSDRGDDLVDFAHQLDAARVPLWVPKLEDEPGLLFRYPDRREDLVGHFARPPRGTMTDGRAAADELLLDEAYLLLEGLHRLSAAEDQVSLGRCTDLSNGQVQSARHPPRFVDLLQLLVHRSQLADRIVSDACEDDRPGDDDG